MGVLMLDDMTVYIPTRGRINQQETWSWLPESVRERTFLVAEETEADILDMMGYPVLAHQEDNIADIRQWIVDQHNADERGPHAIFLDDDLRIDYRRTDVPSKFLNPGKQTAAVEKMFTEYRRILDHAVLAGISPRGGANRNTEPYRFNTRMFMAWGGNLPKLQEMGVEFNRLLLQEDFDVILQVLSQGHRAVLLNTFVVGDAGTNLPGGCSIYRDNEVQSEASRGLAGLWPKYVTPVVRPAWKGMAGDTRLDVRVSWKRAYEDGVRLAGEEEPEFSLTGEDAWYEEDLL